VLGERTEERVEYVLPRLRDSVSACLGEDVGNLPCLQLAAIGSVSLGLQNLDSAQQDREYCDTRLLRISAGAPRQVHRAAHLGPGELYQIRTALDQQSQQPMNKAQPRVAQNRHQGR
jgi:hypothetical protein